jgi:hypothetical protein
MSGVRQPSSRPRLRSALAPFWLHYKEPVVFAFFITLLALATPIFVLQVYDRVVVNLSTTSSYNDTGPGGATHPLFDPDRFRRHLEIAYQTMWEIHRNGHKPMSFAVKPIDRFKMAAE